jgi:hypothetical protein
LDEPEFYRIEGKFKTLTESYLTGKHQKVVLRNRTDSGNSSKWERIICGVPHGLILGRLFFLLYMNELPKIVNNNIVLFADDSSIIVNGTNKLNFQRCKYMVEC